MKDVKSRSPSKGPAAPLQGEYPARSLQLSVPSFSVEGGRLTWGHTFLGLTIGGKRIKAPPLRSDAWTTLMTWCWVCWAWLSLKHRLTFLCPDLLSPPSFQQMWLSNKYHVLQTLLRACLCRIQTATQEGPAKGMSEGWKPELASVAKQYDMRLHPPK